MKAGQGLARFTFNFRIDNKSVKKINGGRVTKIIIIIIIKMVVLIDYMMHDFDF